jgi:nicotinamidase-related amidase
VKQDDRVVALVAVQKATSAARIVTDQSDIDEARPPVVAPDFVRVLLAGAAHQNIVCGFRAPIKIRTRDDCRIARSIEVPEYEVQAEVRVDPARTALVVVDMQNDFVSEGGSLRVPGAEATIPTISRLLKLARAHGMRVVYTQDTHREGDPEWRIWPEHARQGTWGWEIVDALAPSADDTVIRKVRYDAFYGTPLDHLLRVWGVDMLVICGTLANICVHYTAASAALRWYDVVIPRDAISALEPFDVESKLRQTVFVFAGRVTTAAGVRV